MKKNYETFFDSDVVDYAIDNEKTLIESMCELIEKRIETVEKELKRLKGKIKTSIKEL
tara:strand:- start:212 stop:385 length:174 start_codon:yes stop_codon:yes gene_type:complete